MKEIKTKKLRGFIAKGKIVIDRKGLYDKPPKCPINIPIPKTQEDLKFLIESIEWLLSKEGYNASKHYEFEKWRNRYGQ